MSEFSDFGHFICSNDFFIVNVTNTCLNDSISDNIVGLKGISMISTRDSRGGGVALYVKNFHKSSLVYAYSNIDRSKFG